jgi:hypothetical protein
MRSEPGRAIRRSVARRIDAAAHAQSADCETQELRVVTQAKGGMRRDSKGES